MSGKSIDDIRRMSPEEHRRWYNSLYSTYLSHPANSEQAQLLLRQMEALLSFGKISVQEAADIRLFTEAARNEVLRTIQEIQCSETFGMKIRFDYTRPQR